VIRIEEPVERALITAAATILRVSASLQAFGTHVIITKGIFIRVGEVGAGSNVILFIYRLSEKIHRRWYGKKD
jgi:hypothetical protein